MALICLVLLLVLVDNKYERESIRCSDSSRKSFTPSTPANNVL